MRLIILFVSPVPVSLSSFSASSTTSTAQLKWEPLHRQQRISTLTLYNMHTQSVTQIYSISSSAIQSKFTIKNLQPGTHYMIEVMVAIFLPQPGITLMQKLRIFMETGIVLSKNHKTAASSLARKLTVRRLAIVLQSDNVWLQISVQMAGWPMGGVATLWGDRVWVGVMRWAAAHTWWGKATWPTWRPWKIWCFYLLTFRATTTCCCCGQDLMTNR